MKYLDSFKIYESKPELNIDEIKDNCFIDIIDRGYSVKVLPFYLDSSGRHFVTVDYGIEVSISTTDNTTFKIDDIMDELLYAKEYIEERYKFKLDYIFKTHRNNNKYYNSLNDNDLRDSFLQNIKITYKPISVLDKAKRFIKKKF